MSSTPFKGFPTGKVRFTKVPAPFFSDLLPLIDDLGELKVTLYALWFLEQIEGKFRYLRRDDFAGDELFMQGMAAIPGAQPEAALDDALARAVARGTLLTAELKTGASSDCLYFINSPRGQAAVNAIRRGEWRPTGEAHQPVALDLKRPNIFRLYEDNIGVITPLMAETLMEAEREYPAGWIEEAMRIAVENNVRRWRYVEAILRGWQEEGRNGQDRRDAQKGRSRHVESDIFDDEP